MSVTEVQPQGSGPLSTLRRQVIVAMAVMLSPLLIMGGMRVLAERAEARELRFQELLDHSRDRLVSIESTLGRTRLALRMLAVDDRRLSCFEISERLIPLDLPPRNILRFDADGVVTCHLVGNDLVGQPMPDLEWNELLRKGMGLLESSEKPGMALGEPAVHMLHTQFDAAGTFEGSLAFSVGLESIAEQMSPGTAAGSMTHNLVLADGTVIGSDVLSAVPAEWLTSELMMERQLKHMTLPQGRRLDVVLQPLSSSGLWMLTATAEPQKQRSSAIAAFVVPVLAYLAALLAVSWIVDAMVLRWLERLRQRISDLRRTGDFTPLAPELSSSPTEFRQLAEAFDDLTDRVAVHEGELQGALSRMRSAFRETHHRVKNNLQVMLSMLKLQGRGEALPETQKALRIAAHRVAMMAAVHHALLNEASLETVEATDLFNAICDQIHEQQGWFEGGRLVVPEVEPGALPADFAVPLAMFVLEAFNQLCKPSEGETPRDLRLNFSQEGELGQLVLGCDADPLEESTIETSEPGFFLGAFARQIGGSVTQLTDEPGKILISLEFPIDPLASDGS